MMMISLFGTLGYRRPLKDYASSQGCGTREHTSADGLLEFYQGVSQLPIIDEL